MWMHARLAFLSVIMVVFMLLNIAHGEELLGRVVKTIGKQVEIKLDGELIPQIGDKVVIGFNMEPIGFVPLQGKWTVVAINSDTLIANPNGDASQPQKNQIVKISTKNPISRKTMQKEAKTHFEKAEAYFYGNKGEKKDYIKALAFYKKAANNGSLKAMDSIGYMYGTGAGVTKNSSKAVEWFRKAAEGNCADSQRNLAIMYDAGLGVEKNPKIALTWYLKAAKQGNTGAQHTMGIRYQEGEGVEQSQEMSVMWFLNAAKQGHAQSQCDLGTHYLKGKGVPKDDLKAAQWYRKSAGQGNARAQYNLGVVYEYGRGVRKNITDAIIWYRKADANGYSDANKALIRLGDK